MEAASAERVGGGRRRGDGGPPGRIEGAAAVENLQVERGRTIENDVVEAITQGSDRVFQAEFAPLRFDRTLQRAARSHTRTMVSRNVFAHGDFASRMRQFGARGPYLAENLAWGSGSAASPRALVQMWLNSPPHRRSLLRPGFRRVGVGAMMATFSGASGARVVTADFGGR